MMTNASLHNFFSEKSGTHDCRIQLFPSFLLPDIPTTVPKIKFLKNRFAVGKKAPSFKRWSRLLFSHFSTIPLPPPPSPPPPPPPPPPSSLPKITVGRWSGLAISQILLLLSHFAFPTFPPFSLFFLVVVGQGKA